MESAERKLAAILAMDVVSYSAKMSQDEQGTLRQLKECREIIEAIVSEHKGRIFNTAGDAFMIEFASPIAAVTSAIEIQRQIEIRNERLSDEESLRFRIGVNMGDVMVEGKNLFGEGVNVAARLEGVANPGGICISEMIHSVVKGKVEASFSDQGPQELKNIDEPVRAFFVEMGEGEGSSGRANQFSKNKSLKKKVYAAVSAAVFAVVAWVITQGIDSDGPIGEQSLALNTMVVLPVESLSNEQDKLNFAIGISRDLANGLSLTSKKLNVIALSERPKNASKTAREAEAAYVLDGQLRPSGDAFRLTMTLLDAEKMVTIWNKSFDGNMKAQDVFALQDEIVSGVLDELVGLGAFLEQDIAGRIKLKGTTDLSVYECRNYVVGVFWKTWTPDTYKTALTCLEDSVKADPEYADAWSLLGNTMGFGYAFGYDPDEQKLLQAIEHVDRAISLEPTNAMAFSNKMWLSFYRKDWDTTFQAGDRAVELSPVNIQILSEAGNLLVWGGDCSLDQILDRESADEKYTSGTCRWKKGWNYLLQAYNSDKGNNVQAKHYGMATIYNTWEQFDLAYKHMQMAISPGFFWYELHSGIAADGMKKPEVAKKHFESVKKIIGSDKLDDIYKHYQLFHIEDYYWEPSEPMLKKYGFI